MENNTLGSPAASELLEHLKPTYWFSAHLHVKFAALMQHQVKDKEQSAKATKFLALDKCLPHRDFLQVIEIQHDPSAPEYLEYDTEWLAILRATNDLINVTERPWNMPENNGLHTRWDYSATKEAMNEVMEKLNHDLKVPCNFSVTAACYDLASHRHKCSWFIGSVLRQRNFVPNLASLTLMSGFRRPRKNSTCVATMKGRMRWRAMTLEKT